MRIAEFAWSRIGPREGEFDWGWLDDAVWELTDAERQIVTCTPTATPPAWLVGKHLDILPGAGDGRVHEDGQPGPPRDHVGHRLRNFDGMRPGLTVRAGGYVVETWAEPYEPTGAEHWMNVAKEPSTLPDGSTIGAASYPLRKDAR